MNHLDEYLGFPLSTYLHARKVFSKKTIVWGGDEIIRLGRALSDHHNKKTLFEDLPCELRLVYCMKAEALLMLVQAKELVRVFYDA